MYMCQQVGTDESRVSTIVVRGSTDNYMDDIERAIDDGVNVFKGICKVGNILNKDGDIFIIDILCAFLCQN